MVPRLLLTSPCCAHRTMLAVGVPSDLFAMTDLVQLHVIQSATHTIYPPRICHPIWKIILACDLPGGFEQLTHDFMSRRNHHVSKRRPHPHVPA